MNVQVILTIVQVVLSIFGFLYCVEKISLLIKREKLHKYKNFLLSITENYANLHHEDFSSFKDKFVTLISLLDGQSRSTAVFSLYLETIKNTLQAEVTSKRRSAEETLSILEKIGYSEKTREILFSVMEENQQKQLLQLYCWPSVAVFFPVKEWADEVKSELRSSPIREFPKTLTRVQREIANLHKVYSELPLSVELKQAITDVENHVLGFIRQSMEHSVFTLANLKQAEEYLTTNTKSFARQNRDALLREIVSHARVLESQTSDLKIRERMMMRD